MGKYEELDSLQKLKESGSITEKEFEIEKYKILNSNNNTNQSNTEGIYTASLVLGICSFLFGGIPILGLILSIVALVICIKSRKKLKSNNETKGIVTVGLVLSIIGLILSILIFVFVFLGIGIAFMEGENGVLTTSEQSNNATEIATAKEYALLLVVGYQADSIDLKIDNTRDYIKQKIGNGQSTEGGYFITIDNSYKITVYKGINSSAVKNQNKVITGTLTETGSINWN